MLLGLFDPRMRIFDRFLEGTIDRVRGREIMRIGDRLSVRSHSPISRPNVFRRIPLSVRFLDRRQVKVVSYSQGFSRTEVFVSTIAMEKLLSTVIQLKASDLHITVGQPPVIRHQGRMRKLDTKALDTDDTTALMKSITPDRCQQELQEKGGTDFAIEYVDGYRFRVPSWPIRAAQGTNCALPFFVAVNAR